MPTYTKRQSRVASSSWRQRAVAYHTRCAEHYRRQAERAAAGRYGDTPPEKFLALAAKAEHNAEYYGK